MIKHILGQAIWQCILLFVFLFAGEYMVPESVEKYEYTGVNPGFVYPGRAADWDGSELYSREMMADLGPSRHLTFIFTAFVFMQIFNMFCARKIHDELNVFEGLHKNFIFIGVWIIICFGQVIITQFGGRVFVVSLDGLDGAQWGLAIAVGSTSFIINLILKFIPDSAPCIPQIGQDSVYTNWLAERNKDRA